MMTSNAEKKRVADKILYEFGLFEELKKIGTPHIIGSYRMDMMVKNDLDIDVENDNMSLERLHELTAYILKTFHPVWYEAKQEITDEGKTVWFHGFVLLIEGDRFNVDVWFFDQETIARAESYCDQIASRTTDEQKEVIIQLKRELINRGLYRFGKYTSMHVYEAVLEKHITDIKQLFDLYRL